MKARNATRTHTLPPEWTCFLKPRPPTIAPSPAAKRELKKNTLPRRPPETEAPRPPAPRPFCPSLKLRNRTALQVLLKDSIDVCSLSQLSFSLSDARTLSDSGRPAPGSLPLAADEIFPAGAQALRPLVSAAPLPPRLSFPVGSTTEGQGEAEERRLFAPIGRTPRWSDFRQLQTCKDRSWLPANTSALNLTLHEVASENPPADLSGERRLRVCLVFCWWGREEEGGKEGD